MTKPDRQQHYKCLPFGYLDRLHEVNRRVWFYLDPVAADERDNDKVFCGFVLASTLHEFTKRCSLMLLSCELCLNYSILYESFVSMSQTIRQFARKILSNSKLRKEVLVAHLTKLNCLERNYTNWCNIAYQQAGQTKQIFSSFFLLELLNLAM